MATRKVIKKRKGGMTRQLPATKSRGGSRSGQPVRRRKIGRKILAVLMIALIVKVLWINLGVGKFFTLPYSEAVPVDSVKAVVSDTLALRLSINTDTATQTPVGAVDADSVAIDSTSRSGFASVLESVRAWTNEKVNSLFVVREVRFNGALSVRQDTLMALIGEVYGLPMYDLDLVGMADKMSRHPRLSHVEIIRQLPGTLEIRIHERRELALITTTNGLLGLDVQGVALSEPVPGWPLDVPVITGATWSLGVGDTISTPELVDALAWIRIAGREPRVQVWLSEVHVSSGGVDWVSGINGWRVRPGKYSLGAQVSTLNAYLDEQGIENRSNRMLDLRFPDFLIVKHGS